MPNIEVVEQLSAARLPLIKLQPKSKDPILGVGWLYVASLVGDALAKHNKDTVKHFKSGGNVGLAFPPQLMGMDIDPRADPKVKGREREAWSIDTPDSPADRFFKEVCEIDNWKSLFVWTKTPGGGAHVYFKRPHDLLPPGKLSGDLVFVEFKHFGGYVVAPGSTHPNGGIYQLNLPTLEDELDGLYTLQNLPDLPSGLIRNIEGAWTKLQGAEGVQGSSGEAGGTHEASDIEKLLDGVNPEDFRDQADWFTFMQGINHATEGCAEAMAVFVAWCLSDPLYAHYKAAIEKRWTSLGGKTTRKPVTIGSALWLLKDKGYTGKGGPSTIEREADMAKFDDGSGEVADDPADPTGVGAASKGDRPVVIITGSNREQVIKETAAHLFDSLGSESLFYRGEELVSVSQIGSGALDAAGKDADKIVWTVDQKGRKCFERNGIRLYPGATIVTPVSGTMLRFFAGETIEYKKPNVRAKKRKDGSYPIVPTDAPTDVKDLVELSTEWLFQELMAMVMAPVIDFETGDVLTQSGVLPGTGVLAKFNPEDFKGIRTDLSQEEAQAKLDWVHDLLYKHFPFEGGPRGPSSAVNMTACFGALLRPVMDQGCPAHAFDAPQASSGKSKLSETHGIIATGAIPAMAAWSNDDKENEKRLGALLRRAPQVIVYDNLDAKNKDVIQFAHMNTAVTATKVAVRILTTSDAVDMPCLTFIEFNGNNIQVSGDMATRIVKCRIDAKMPNPQTRVFDFDPVARAQARRGEIVVALLSVVASYIKAGHPMDNQLLPMRFGKAWRAVQGAVMWCGWDDPVKTVEEVMATDERRMIENEAAELWLEVFGEEPVAATELFRIYDKNGGRVSVGEHDGEDEVDASLIYEVILTSNSRSQALSKSLRDGKVFGDYMMKVGEEDGKGKTVWLVRQAD